MVQKTSFAGGLRSLAPAGVGRQPLPVELSADRYDGGAGDPGDDGPVWSWKVVAGLGLGALAVGGLAHSIYTAAQNQPAPQTQMQPQQRPLGGRAATPLSERVGPGATRATGAPQTRVGSDGVVTVPVGRGTTIDSEGRVETRIGERTSIRSDGTVNWEVSPNTSIRSDGTISTRINKNMSIRSDGTVEWHFGR